MEIPLCHMIFMQVVRLALTNDVLKLWGDFYSCYHPRAIVFYVFFEGIDGCIVDVTLERTNGWDDHWKIVDEEFEEFFKSKPSLHHLMEKLFHVWDEITCLKLGFHTSMRSMRRTNQGMFRLQVGCLMQIWKTMVFFGP